MVTVSPFLVLSLLLLCFLLWSKKAFLPAAFPTDFNEKIFIWQILSGRDYFFIACHSGTFRL